MKNSIFSVLAIWVLLLFSNQRAYSQDSISTWLTLSYNGFEPAVFEVKDNTSSDLYKKAKKWASSFYPNLDKELIYDSINYQIKIRTTKPEAFYMGLKRNLFDVDYTLIISFKENKYRVQVEMNKFFYNPRNIKYSADGEIQETGWDQRIFYSSEKELDPHTNPGYSELQYTMYEISTSLYKEMSKKVTPEQIKTEDDW